MLNTRSSIQYVVNKYGCPETAAEIGVQAGDNAFGMLSEYPIKHMFLVDSYLAYNDDGRIMTEKDQDRFLQYTLLRLRPMFNRISFMLMSSVEASKFIPDNSLDYVYIDANHSYETVKEDIKCWYPKTKILAGHDYTGSHKGVAQAVDEFVASNNNLVLAKLSDRDWLIDKR